MITKEMATTFYCTLCYIYNGDWNKTCQGIASAEHIADSMHMTIEKVNEFCHAMLEYKITERQGGGYVI